MKNLYLLIVIFSFTSSLSFSQIVSKKQKILEEIPVQTKPVREISEQKNLQADERGRPHGNPERKEREIIINPPKEPDPPQRIEPVKEEAEVYVESNIKFTCHSGRCNFQHEVELILSKGEILKLEGIKNFKDEKYLEALMNFCNAIAESPEDLDLYFYRGCTNVKLGNYLWAIEDLDFYISQTDAIHYLEFPPKISNRMLLFSEAFYSRGLAKFYNKEKESAYIDLESAAKTGSKSAIIFLKRFY